MCKVGGPRCSHKWGQARKDLSRNPNSEKAQNLAQHEQIGKERHQQLCNEYGVSEHMTIREILTEPPPHNLPTPRLTGRQRESVARYVDHEYRELNRNLRVGELTEEQERIHEGLLGSFDEHAQKVHVPLYRGFTTGHMKIDRRSSISTALLRAYPIGATITSPTWMSVSENPELAASYGKHVRPVENPDHFVNHTHVVMRVLGATTLNVSGASHMPHEREHVIKPGSELRVVGHQVMDDGCGKEYVVLTVEHIH